MSQKANLKNFFCTHPVYSETLPEIITDDFPLIESGMLDSIGIYTLIVHLEKSFNVQIEPRDLHEKNFGNLNKIEEFLSQKLK